MIVDLKGVDTGWDASGGPYYWSNKIVNIWSRSTVVLHVPPSLLKHPNPFCLACVILRKLNNIID